MKWGNSGTTRARLIQRVGSRSLYIQQLIPSQMCPYKPASFRILVIATPKIPVSDTKGTCGTHVRLTCNDRTPHPTPIFSMVRDDIPTTTHITHIRISNRSYTLKTKMGSHSPPFLAKYIHQALVHAIRETRIFLNIERQRDTRGRSCR